MIKPVIMWILEPIFLALRGRQVTGMGKFLRSVSIGMLIGMWVAVCVAEEGAQVPTEGLDEQVQSIKREVLRISAEIIKLQEKLMYPSDTQISLFVSLAQGDKLRLDAVTIRIDGKVATSYIYTAKELEALQHAGVQRIYTGNIRGGTHTLEVEIIGKLTNNTDYQQSTSHKFYKMKGPKVIEITLSESGSTIQSIAD